MLLRVWIVDVQGLGLNSLSGSLLKKPVDPAGFQKNMAFSSFFRAYIGSTRVIIELFELLNDNVYFKSVYVTTLIVYTYL